MHLPVDIAILLEKAINDYVLLEWEFLYFNKAAALRGRMTPEGLLQSYDHKLIVRNVASHTPRLRQLIHALRTTRFASTSSNMDIRFGLIIRNNRNEEIATLFMDFSSRLAIVNGASYHLNGELSAWFNDLAQTTVRIL